MLRCTIMGLAIWCVAGCSDDGNDEVGVAPSKEDVAAIRKNLTRFEEPGQWRGDRWRVTGLREGYPVTESIGSWQIETVATDQKGVIELSGIKIGQPRSVRLDFTTGLLIIDGQEFAGRPIAGKSPIVRDAPFKGALFERKEGGIYGSATILLLEDGRALVDFYKVWAKDKRGEYGVLTPSKKPN